MQKIFGQKKKQAQQTKTIGTKKYLNEQLFKSVQSRQRVTLKNALKSGADPNCYDSNKQTPLVHAVKKIDFKSIKLLLDAGALATMDLPRNISLAHILTKGEINEKSLKILKLLIINKAPLSIQADTGYTPLHYAVTNDLSTFENKLACINLLLDHNVSCNEPTNTNLTPLHLSISIAHNQKLAHYFVNLKNIKINAKSDERQTPLTYAIQYDLISIIISLLTQPKIKTKIIDRYNKSALEHAKQNGKKKIGRLLLAHLGFYSYQGLIAQKGLVQIFPKPVARTIAAEYIKNCF